jgi:radical SAM superfamily enzyme YgiQ (UPF0313 family)
MPEELFVEQLTRFTEPDAILVTSFMTYWYPGPQHVIRIVRRIFPDIPVILGGIYTTLMPDHAREMLQPDYLIEGAGEVKIAELLADILDGAPRPPATIRSLDDFPFPAFDLYTKLNYLPLMTSRGCPYHCTFCATDKISGAYAQRTPEAVFQEIRHFVGKFRIRDIAFYDDALLLNAGNRIIPLLEKIIQFRMPVRFHTPNGLHAGQMNKQVAALFSQAGFSTIRLSFETASPERLNDMNFKVTPDQLSAAVQNLESAGYSRSTIESYVMMGLPHQTFQEIYESIIFVHSLGIKVRLASFSPIPGTPDYERAVSEGLFPDQADPLLTNKTIYPLHRNIGMFRKFSEIRQLVNAVNQATERQTKLFSPPELRSAFEKILNNGLDG